MFLADNIVYHPPVITLNSHFQEYDAGGRGSIPLEIQVLGFCFFFFFFFFLFNLYFGGRGRLSGYLKVCTVVVSAGFRTCEALC